MNNRRWFGNESNNSKFWPNDGFNDTMMGLGGRDSLGGGDGHDHLYGGDGDDTLAGARGNDILYGGRGNDYLSGGSGTNSLYGGDGDDTLESSNGNDTMWGEKGNDIYFIFSNSKATVIEKANEGIDTVRSFVSVTLPDHVENLTLLGNANINGFGNELDNVIVGNSKPNFIKGLKGNDTMRGGAGNDTYVVDSLSDSVVESANEGTDAVYADVTGYILPAHVENLTLGLMTSPASGFGNALDNLIFGNANSNVIDGKGGNDTMRGARGDDSYTVDSRQDSVIERANEGTDSIYSYVSGYQLPAHAERLFMMGSIYNGLGNELDNYIEGNQSNNYINGGQGNDTMRGFKGNDHYVVDSLSDRVVESAGQGTDTVITKVYEYRLPDYVENLKIRASGNVLGKVYGNSLDNRIEGNYLHSYIDGGDGDDTMIGGRGRDYYIVNSPGDVVLEFANEGKDRVITNINGYRLPDHVEELSLRAETGYGNSLDNLIWALERNNTAEGLAGDDYMRGEGGSDTLIGGQDSDKLVGYGALFPGNASEFDVLIGDNVESRPGQNRAGDGADLFVLGDTQAKVFYLGEGYAVIKDFNALEGDIIQLHGSKSSYELRRNVNYGGGSKSDTGIFYGNDLIGIVEDMPNVFLDSDFEFVI